MNANAPENELRAFVAKRKGFGRTLSDGGREARDLMLGLAKTCMKLKPGAGGAIRSSPEQPGRCLVSCDQSREVDALGLAVDDPPCARDHHPVRAMGAAEGERGD